LLTGKTRFPEVSCQVALQSIRVTAGAPTQGEDWEEGFASGLLNSLCFFPLLSYGATAPLAAIAQSSLQQTLSLGWDERPAGRARLCGSASDAEDNLLKEYIIAATLLQQAAAADRGDSADALAAKRIAGEEGGEGPTQTADDGLSECAEEAEQTPSRLQASCFLPRHVSES
jgi:hypothetical protein